jgi:hypothetical protein
MEMGGVAEQAKDAERAGKLYRKAYRTFISLNMPDSAKMLKGKLPQDADGGTDDSDLDPESEQPMGPQSRGSTPQPDLAVGVATPGLPHGRDLDLELSAGPSDPAEPEADQDEGTTKEDSDGSRLTVGGDDEAFN